MFVVPSSTSGLTAGASAGIAIGIGFLIYKKTKKVEPGPPDQGVPPAATRMPIEEKSRPDLVRNMFHTNRMHTSNELPDIESRDKVPRLEREFTQHSTLRQQIITPSVVNPMVREWTDMGDSDNLTLIDSDFHSQLDPRTPTPPGLPPVNEI